MLLLEAFYTLTHIGRHFAEIKKLSRSFRNSQFLSEKMDGQQTPNLVFANETTPDGTHLQINNNEK